MGLQILSCPAVVEAFETFTVVLGNNERLSPNLPLVLEMTMLSETETLMTAGQPERHFMGEEVLKGDTFRSARFSFHPLRFLPEAANRTWTMKFKIVNPETEDVITHVRQDIRVILPPTRDDAKPHHGVKRKTTHSRPTNA